MIYFDTSAFAKLVWHEAESDALWKYVVERQDESHVSSRLLVVEMRRAALRNGGAQLPRVDLALERVNLVDITTPVTESASRIPEPSLRSLDAIHLATALLLGREVSSMVTYDKRLATTASASGLLVTTPE